MPFGGKGPVVVGVLWAENFLSAIFIGLRFYTRTYVKGKVGWDDYALITTWFLMVMFAAMTTAAAAAGMGRHIEDLTLEEFSNAMFLELIAQVIVAVAIGLAEVVVSLFLMRIVVNGWHKGILWFCIIAMMALSVLLVIAVFAQCTPIQSIWDPRLATKRVCHLNLTLLVKIDCGMPFS